MGRQRLGRNKADIDPLASANEVYATKDATTTTGSEDHNGQQPDTRDGQEPSSVRTPVESTHEGDGEQTAEKQTAVSPVGETREIESTPESATDKKTKTKTTRGGREKGNEGVEPEKKSEVPLAPLDVTSVVRQLRERRHLSGYTFRYHAKELQEIDRLYKIVEESLPDTLSKNDVARLMVIAFVKDYELHGDASLFAQVLARL